MAQSKWQYDDSPREAGWYPVFICWDDQEGPIPSAAEWDGVKWSERAVIAFGDWCSAKEDAMWLAYVNDPGTLRL